MRLSDASRRTIRTTLQTLFGALITLGLIVPAIVEIILDEVGEVMPAQLRGWLLVTSAAAAASSGIATRVMAIPRVEKWLQRRAPMVAAQSPAGDP